MAHADEALDLKRRARRRLIGAIALVLFLVIVPPWIMDLEPQPVETTLEVEIPQPDERPLPVVPPQTEGPAPEQPAAPAPAVEAPAAEPQAETPKQTAKPATPPAGSKPEAKADKPAAAKGEAYVVPVATLSTEGNVKELQAKLSLAGLESYTEPVKTASGQYTRVRAGPYASKAEAEKVHARLREMGLKPGNVTTR